MKGNNKIYGVNLHPSVDSLDDFKFIISTSDMSVSKNFMQHYEKHLAGMQIVAMCAKIYVINNWQKIEDWSDLEVVIEDNSDSITTYYNYKEEKENNNFNKHFDFLNRQNKKRHNPILEIKDVVLDTTDGDFSLTINGKDHNWISDDSVIVIASYIEKILENSKI